MVVIIFDNKDLRDLVCMLYSDVDFIVVVSIMKVLGEVFDWVFVN